WHQCCGRLQASMDPTGSGTIRNTDYFGNITHTAVAANLPTDVILYGWHDVVDADTVNETTTRYDGLHRPTHTTVWLQPLAFVTDHARASLGNGVIPIAGEDAIPVTDGLTTRYVYDDNLTDGIGLDVAYASYLVSLNLGSGSDGKAVEVTNPENEKTVTIYDGLGRVIKIIDGLGDAKSMAYDAVVNIAGFGDVVETAAADALNHTNKQRTDGVGRIMETVDAANNITGFSYDANSNKISFRDSNNVGQDCIFDERNRDVSCTDTQGDTTSRIYDANNNIVSSTDGVGNVTLCVFDARGCKDNCTDRINAVTAYVYDANNNLTSITDAEGGITTYAYDVRNLLETEVLPTGDAGTTQKAYTYDATRRLANRVVNTVEAPLTLETTTYTYDMANRLLTRGYPEEVAADDTFTYDAASRLLTAHSNRYDNTVTRTYDDDSKLLSESLNIDSTDYDISYSYDEADRQINITYPNGKVVVRSYTDRNQLEDVSYDGSVVSTSVYDVGRRETNRNLSNGINTVKTYRNDNLISSIVASGNVLNLAYTYDANKRKLTETDALRASASQTFNYDTEDRLTSWSTDSATTNQNWTLSLVGDWDATVRTGADSINETRTHTDVHEATNVNGNVLSYDFKGNLTINSSNSQNYVWDAENRMESIGNSVDAEYRYDALGHRVQKAVTVNLVTTTTTFICGGAQVFTEYENGVEKQSYIYASYVDDPVALISSIGTMSFYHCNHLYSTEVVTDNFGVIVETVDYNSYGKTILRDSLDNIIANSTVDNPYYFTGRRLDAESGLYYFRTRYFDVDLGRFISRDSLGYVDGFGLYGSYFSVNGTDPTGAKCVFSVYPKMPSEPWNERLFGPQSLGYEVMVTGKAVFWDDEDTEFWVLCKGECEDPQASSDTFCSAGYTPMPDGGINVRGFTCECLSMIACVDDDDPSDNTTTTI
ncbi:MAG: hypothetical protein HRU15_16670, partial [Planctomycetes bacterium]|nr:hypothetical protein [Planctomycetota bacterium]